MRRLWRVGFVAGAMSLLLTGCGGGDDDGNAALLGEPSGSDAGSVVGSGNNGGDDGIGENLPPAMRVAAYQFETDLRDEERDGVDGLKPILSSAPPTCMPAGYVAPAYVSVEVPAPTPDNPDATETVQQLPEGVSKDYSLFPACDDVKSVTYNEQGLDTWIDATVFVPDHMPGERLPVILHSHGWGGSKVTSLVQPGDCALEGAGYDCQLPGAATDGLFGFFGSVDALLGEFRNNGYVVVSFTERGWGESEGEVMIMNPYHETQDAIAVMDWIGEMAQQGNLPVAIDQDGDMPIGVIGGSYGGGFQFPLASLDTRVDALIAAGTWNSLSQSITPNGNVKAGYGSLLCVLGATARQHPYLADACSRMSPLGGALSGILGGVAGGGELAIDGLLPLVKPLVTSTGLGGLVGGVLPNAAAPSRFIDQLDPDDTALPFLAMNGLSYFDQLAEQNLPFREGEVAFIQRPLDVLLIQGMTDTLFPMQEAVNNYRYLNDKGGDVRLLSNQGGHMNIIQGQQEGTFNCGSQDVFAAARAWFDVKVKQAGAASSLAVIPEVCISLDDESAVALLGVPGIDPLMASELPQAMAFGLHIEQRTDVPTEIIDQPQQCNNGETPERICVGGFGSSCIFGSFQNTCDNQGGYVDAIVTPNDDYREPQSEICAPLYTAGSGDVLAGVPVLEDVTVAPIPGVSARQQAQLGVCVIRNGETLLVDEQLNAIDSGSSLASSGDAIEMIAVGERLKAGDQVGIYALASSEYFNFADSLDVDELANMLSGLIDGIEVPVTYEAGDVMQDENGVDIYEYRVGDPVVDADGNPVVREAGEIVEENGQPVVLHAVGDPVLDENGSPVVDQDGAPVLYDQAVYETYMGGEPVLHTEDQLALYEGGEPKIDPVTGEQELGPLLIGEVLGDLLTPDLLLSLLGLEGIPFVGGLLQPSINEIAAYDNAELIGYLADGIESYTVTPVASYEVEGSVVLPIFKANGRLTEMSPQMNSRSSMGQQRSSESVLMGR